MKKGAKKIRVIDISDSSSIQLKKLSQRYTESDLQELDEFEKRLEKRYREQLEFHKKLLDNNCNIDNCSNITYDDIIEQITKKNKLLKLMSREQEK